MDFLNLNNVTDKEGKLNTVLNQKYFEKTFETSIYPNTLHVYASVIPLIFLGAADGISYEGLASTTMSMMPGSSQGGLFVLNPLFPGSGGARIGFQDDTTLLPQMKLSVFVPEFFMLKIKTVQVIGAQPPWTVTLGFTYF